MKAFTGNEVQEAQELQPELSQLEKEGYPLHVLQVLKRIIRSSLLKRRLISLVKKYKDDPSAKPQRIRVKTIKEILSSEKVYLHSLKKALKVYYEPLMDSVDSQKPILSRHDIQEIFSKLEIISEMGSHFYHDLKARLNDTNYTFKIGDILLRLIPILKIYSYYIRNFDLSQKLLKEKLETNAAFALFIKTKSLKNEQLDSFLIMPVQRLPRYEMLLKQLLEFTPSSHIDYSEIFSALERIKGITFEINRLKRKDISERRIRELQNSFVGLPLTLTSSGRFLIWEGKLFLSFRPSDNAKSHYGEYFSLFIFEHQTF